MVRVCGHLVFLQVPYSREEMGYGVEFRDEPPDTVTISATSSHAQVCTQVPEAASKNDRAITETNTSTCFQILV